MITTDLVRICAVGSAAELSYPMQRERAQQWIDQNGGRGPVEYELRPAIICECCGEIATYWIDRDQPRHGRCRKHQMRNPCMIEGCKRSSRIESVREYANDQTICGTHWRELVPVGSPERRIYLRFFRRAKRFGWTDNSVAAFHRFWDALASRVRARARGDVDMDEINRLMGW
jgi:hypothetical protein